MKVISIQEPYATLISTKHKKIETRSWKTNYRGEILIHASLGKTVFNSIKNDDILKLTKELNYGKIICKANLVDCIKMDEKFLEEIKKSQEYILGIYELNRYAWILEDIQLLKQPIQAKGKLNIWEYEIDEKTID